MPVAAAWGIDSPAIAQATLAEGQMDLGELRRQALSVAVITQVHVAREQHEQALADYRTAVRLDADLGRALVDKLMSVPLAVLELPTAVLLKPSAMASLPSAVE